jgi:hypothetical protein
MVSTTIPYLSSYYVSKAFSIKTDSLIPRPFPQTCVCVNEPLYGEVQLSTCPFFSSQVVPKPLKIPRRCIRAVARNGTLQRRTSLKILASSRISTKAGVSLLKSRSRGNSARVDRIENLGVTERWGKGSLRAKTPTLESLWLAPES